jgi:hypothetical protein
MLNQLFMNRLSGLFHKKIYLLWNGISGLFLIMVQDMSLTEKGINPIALTHLDIDKFHFRVYWLQPTRSIPPPQTSDRPGRDSSPHKNKLQLR